MRRLLKKLYEKKAEGVVTGMLWLAIAVIAAGGISYAMWGSSGVGGAATTSKATFGTEMNKRIGTGTGGAAGLTP